jgi:hypothetical protein
MGWVENDENVIIVYFKQSLTGQELERHIQTMLNHQNLFGCRITSNKCI